MNQELKANTTKYNFLIFFPDGLEIFCKSKQKPSKRKNILYRQSTIYKVLLAKNIQFLNKLGILPSVLANVDGGGIAYNTVALVGIIIVET